MGGLKLSANLGFLWTDRPLPAAVRAARNAGFSAVELHWPYDVDPEDLKTALSETGLPVLGLNTVRGDVAAGEFGLAAVPGREAEARENFSNALDYARAIGATNIHVMAGKSSGIQARQCFIDHLRWARDRAQSHGIGILIEPLNSRDVPGYFLTDCSAAAEIIEDCGGTDIRIMFDCYHMQIMGGDILSRFKQFRGAIGHIQFAAVPDRMEPDHGELDHGWLLPALKEAGWDGYFGAEYKSERETDAGLGWMGRFR